MTIDRRTFLSTSGRAAAGVFAGTLVPVWWKPSADGRVMFERKAIAMGTTVSITAFGERRQQLIEATSAACEELYRLDRLLSVFRPTSEISQLNSAGVGEPVQLSETTMEALEDAQRYTKLTQGRFDVTVGGLLSSLGFHNDGGVPRPVTDRELSDVMEGIGWRHVRLEADGRACRTHPATQIDLGGIGAGFAVDRMGSILRRHGVESALIDHSGDLLAIGAPPDADGWSVVIPDPNGFGEYLQQISLRDRAISTSTNTMNTRTVGGRTVGHILEPNSGENPRDILSVSVLAPNSTEADALSTALFVQRDPESTWRNGEREAIVVRPDGHEHAVVRLH